MLLNGLLFFINSLEANMYSNKNFAFFFIIMCFTPCESQLRPDYYDNTCPRLNSMVLWGVWKATQSDSRIPASLLRLHFHDCFVNGCDASVLLDDTPKIKGEKTALPNNNSLRGFGVIDTIKKDVETWCPRKIVSCADILALAARAAVKISLQQYSGWEYWNVNVEPWQVSLGRLDGLVPNFKGANSEINSPFDSVDTLISKFAAKGLDTQDLAVLSGAHTIGMGQCLTFKRSRLYTKPLTMDPTLLRNLRGICPNNNNSNNKLAPLDSQSPTKFDNSYYNNLLNQKGVLKTDQDLASDERTSGFVNGYNNDPESFINDFGDSMGKMGEIGVLTKEGNLKGEIREICRTRNSNKK